MTTCPIATLQAAMRAANCRTVGDLVAYCREHGTTPQALADQASP